MRLRAEGIRPGDRVVIFLDKSIASVAVLFGIWQAGAVSVPAFHGLKARQLNHILIHSGAKLLITSQEKFIRLSNSGQMCLTSILLLGDEDTLAAADGEKSHVIERTSLTDPAVIFYTSGSTGPAKGVSVSHGNLFAGIRIVSRYLNLTDRDRILSVLPLSFDYGMNQLLSAVSIQSSIVLLNEVSVGDVCQSLERFAITGLAAVPPFWNQLCGSRSTFLCKDFPNLRYITNSGGALPIPLIRRIRERHPDVQIYLMYGLTEAFRSTYLPPSEIDSRPTSIGRAIAETEIIVLNPDGENCEPGEIGELVHVGPTVALGYWNDQEATAVKFRPHPFVPREAEKVVFSGDLVKTDEDGFLYFIGRVDEILKIRGHRVNPSEVEQVIHESAMVSEIVVKGEIDPCAETILVAHCVPNTIDFQAEQLLAFCKREMPSYMVPQAIIVHEQFARTPTGKIDRQILNSRSRK